MNKDNKEQQKDMETIEIKEEITKIIKIIMIDIKKEGNKKAGVVQIQTWEQIKENNSVQSIIIKNNMRIPDINKIEEIADLKDIIEIVKMISEPSELYNSNLS